MTAWDGDIRLCFQLLQKDIEYRDLFRDYHYLLQIGKGLSVLLFSQVLNAPNDLPLDLPVCLSPVDERNTSFFCV
jgi:hypothetical protein